MLWYIFKRLLASIGTLLVVLAITFFLMNAVPGSPFLTEKSTPEQIALANAKYGLDKPLIVQFKNYLVTYAKGDLGVSLKMQEGTPVTDILFHQGKFQLSIRLGLIALCVAIVIGIPLGGVAAYNRGTWIDGFLRVLTTIGVAIPTFVLATLLLVTFAVNHNFLPTISGSLDSFKAYVMPIISLSFYYTCYLAKLTRTSMLDAINQDYIRTAYAKGLSERAVVYIHALKNAVIPVITYLGPLTAGILTGSFVVEQVFGVPGLGTFFVTSISNRDYTTIMGVTIFYSALLVFFNLIADVCLGFIDPRIKLR